MEYSTQQQSMMSLNHSNNQGCHNSIMTHQLMVKDKTYLLRCALTYNWDYLLEFCDLLLEVLEPSKARISRKHLKYRDAAVSQLMKHDEWGNTCLHAACYNHPPLRVITTLLKCANAANLQNWHMSLSRDLSTPLNIACATGASTDIIHVLLNPQLPGLVVSRASGGGSGGGGQAVAMADARGCTPLSELVIHYELQRKSQQTYFASTTAPPSLGSITLMDSSVDEQDNCHNKQEDDGDDFIMMMKCSSSGNVIKNLDPFFESFWIKVDLIIKAAWSETGRPWISMLHGAASIADSCPTSLAELICRSYGPKYITCSAPLSNHLAGIGFGLLPLHLAILANCNTTTNNTENYYNHQLVKQKTNFIKILIDYYPESVNQHPFPVNGRSVFCQAIALGLTWSLKEETATTSTTTAVNSSNISDKDSTMTTLSTSTKPNTTTKGPLTYIFENGDPDVLTTPDVSTGLVPFLLASTTATATTPDAYDDEDNGKSNSNKSNSEKDILELDTVFELLRLHPQVLGDALL